MSAADEQLRKLGFQRGVLTLLNESGKDGLGLEKAIEEVDTLIEEMMLSAAR